MFEAVPGLFQGTHSRIAMPQFLAFNGVEGLEHS